MYGRGLKTRPQWAVCSCKNYSVALVSWAAAAFLLKLLHVLVCSVSPNCFLEGGRWKGSSVFYIYISMGRDRQSRLFCAWSVQPGDGFSKHEMPFSLYGFCFVLGRDRGDTSTSNSPLSSVLLLMRGCSTEADHPLLPSKWHNCKRDCKRVFSKSLPSFFIFSPCSLLFLFFLLILTPSHFFFYLCPSLFFFLSVSFTPLCSLLSHPLHSAS